MSTAEERQRTRWATMAEAARLVCSACAGMSFPCYPEYRELRDGPPGSGNLVHIARPKGREDHPIVSGCTAASIWHGIAFERGFGGGAGVRALELFGPDRLDPQPGGEGDPVRPRATRP